MVSRDVEFLVSGEIRNRLEKIPRKKPKPTSEWIPDLAHYLRIWYQTSYL